MKASPWEKEDAMHEGIPIINCHVPKAFVHEGGKLVGMRFEIVEAVYDAKGRRRLEPTGEPDVFFDCDEVLIAVGQENAFPWIERDAGIAVRRLGPADAERRHLPVDARRTSSSAATRPSARRTSSPRWRTATRRRCRSTASCTARTWRSGRRRMTNLVSQKMGIHEWSYDNAVSNDARFKVPWAKAETALASIKVEVELGFDAATAFKETQRCLNCDVQTVFTEKLCIECDACVDICPMDCITFTDNGDEADLRTRLKAPARNLTQALYVSAPLKTGRVMVKDEDVCLHCGLCAERCPTGAWDMQKFLLQMTHAGPACRDARTAGSGGHGMKRLEAVNDFVVKFANVNGSGSASANELFAKAILRMGVPVSPRNIFPSNIQGLPTWYEVRVSERGWLGRRGGIDMMVAMNPQTWAQDVREVETGGYLFYDSTRPLPPSAFRDDMVTLGMPITAICNATYDDPRQRQLFKNILYVGALAQLLGIDIDVIETLFSEQYRGKERLLASNVRALHLGRDFAASTCSTSRSACASRSATRSASASSSTATPPRRWAASTAAPRSAPGTRSRPRRRWPRPSRSTAPSSASTRRPASTATPSCRPRTRSPRSAWSPAPAGTARAPSPPPRARASA